MSRKKPMILINALHTVTGGGLVYLQHVLPELAKDRRFRWMLLLNPAVVGVVDIPHGVEVKIAPALRFGLSHLWEQLWLPFLARWWGAKLVWSNANYGPLLAPRASVTIHTTPKAAAAWKGWKWKIYWAGVRWMTRLSLWRAPVAFTVARHVLPHYVGARVARKILTAAPAVGGHRGFGGTRDMNQLVAVGDVYGQKQYGLLMQVVAKLREQMPEVRLLLIGRPVQAEAEAELEAAMDAVGVRDCVTWVKGASHKEVMAHVTAAGLLVNVSSAECFNMPVLEAMSVGTPVVLPDVDFQFEVAGDAAVYVPVDKGGDVVAAFAVACLGVLANASIHGMLVRKGLARAQMFGWERTGRVMTDALARILGVR